MVTSTDKFNHSFKTRYAIEFNKKELWTFLNKCLFALSLGADLGQT